MGYGIKAIFWALALALVLKLFCFDFIIAQGRSMEPTIQDGAVLVVNRMQYGIRLPWMKGFLIRWGEPRVGEIVVFFTPAGELAVKRNAGLTEYGFIAVGDNESASYDSRAYGPVPFDNVIGRVLGF